MRPPAPGNLRCLVASDGVPLAYRLFLSSGRQRAALVHLHGIQSHGAWYVDTAAELARRGYVVYLLDRRGSGANPEPRGHVRNRAQWLDDLRRFVDLVRESHPDLPIFLIGGCWGAKLAVAFALREQETLAGVALVCPALHVKIDLPLRDKLKVALGLAMGGRWRIPVPLTPEMFTNDPAHLRFIRDDGLSLRRATARFFFETFLLDREVTTQQHRLILPLLLLQSSPDPIVDEATLGRWFDRVGSARKRCVTYANFGHILDFAPERQRYWDDLGAWLDAVSAGSDHRSDVRRAAPS
jgi:alpha-beta hydrolase superfamily lysophospholipase